MKLKSLFVSLALAGAVVSCAPGTSSPKGEGFPSSAKTVEDSAAFYIGYSFAGNLKKMGMKEINYAMLNEGIKTQFNDGEIDMQKANSFMQAYMQKLQMKAMKEREAEGKKALEAGQKFLEKTKAEAGVDTLSDGILYKVVKEGKGEKPSATSTVRVNYKGSLIDGKVFDESKKPVEFALNRVIKGWGIALQSMPVGSKWTIYIPSNLAYGARGAGDAIGPNETLIFDVELLAVVKKDDAKKAKK